MSSASTKPFAVKQKPLAVKVVDAEAGCPFIQIPRMWFVAPYEGAALFDEAKGVPPSYWVFALRLWSSVMSGNANREATFSMRQFGIRKDDASKWTRAVAVSGLYDVTAGAYDPRTSTKFKYRVDATHTDWRCFMCALADVIRVERKNRIDSRGNLDAFQILLAARVDETRRAGGLPEVNQDFLDRAVKDGKGTRMADGKIKVNVVRKEEFASCAA